MIRAMLGFTVGTLFAVAVLVWIAPRPPLAAPPAPGWYNADLIIRAV